MNAQVTAGCVPLGPKGFWSALCGGVYPFTTSGVVIASEFFSEFSNHDKWMDTEGYMLVEVQYGQLAIVWDRAAGHASYGLWNEVARAGGSVWYAMRSGWVLWSPDGTGDVSVPRPLSGSVCRGAESILDVSLVFPELCDCVVTFQAFVQLARTRPAMCALELLAVRAVSEDAVVLIEGVGDVDKICDAMYLGLYAGCRVLSAADVMVEFPQVQLPVEVVDGYCYLQLIEQQYRREAYRVLGRYPSVRALRERNDWLIEPGAASLATTAVEGLVHVVDRGDVSVVGCVDPEQVLVGAGSVPLQAAMTDHGGSVLSVAQCEYFGMRDLDCDVIGVLRLHEDVSAVSEDRWQAKIYHHAGMEYSCPIMHMRDGGRVFVDGHYLVRGNCRFAGWEITALQGPISLIVRGYIEAQGPCSLLWVDDRIGSPRSNSNSMTMANTYDTGLVEVFYPPTRHSVPEMVLRDRQRNADGTVESTMVMTQGAKCQLMQYTPCGGVLVFASDGIAFKFGPFRKRGRIKIVAHRSDWNLNTYGFVFMARAGGEVRIVGVDDHYAWDCSYDSDPLDTDDIVCDW